MKDYILTQIYNDIRGSEWPDIDNSIYDYYRLPVHIQQECEEDFKIFENIENQDYWIDKLTPAITPPDYEKNKFCYIPTPKCASTYYQDLFFKLEWKKTDFFHSVDSNNTRFFTCIIHPLKRYFKGLAQFIYQHDLHKVEKIYNKIIDGKNGVILIPDAHSMPYTHSFSDSVLENLFCMPIDFLTDEQSREYLLAFFEAHGYEIDLPVTDRIHVSSPEKSKIYTDLVSRLQNNKDLLHAIYRLGIGKDINLYRRSIRNYQYFTQTGKILTNYQQ